mgnify:CR=1 FL=1
MRHLGKKIMSLGKRFLNWQVALACILIGLSVFFYFIHYLIFRDLHHIFIYLLGDIAFLFVDVLIVMLVLHRLLEYRDKRAVLKKLNMVIGTFFCEVGAELLKKTSYFDQGLAALAKRLLITNDWTDKEFTRVRKYIKHHENNLDSKKGNLGQLKEFLIGKRPFLLSLLENPNLLEHESFTDLLWAMFHLSDELSHRKGFDNLPQADIDLMMSHINSYSRKDLGNKSPYEVFAALYGEELLTALGAKKIPPADITLRPTLLKK